jgi:hypothetical protein
VASNASTFWILPPVWIVESLPFPIEENDKRTLSDEVYRRELSIGIRVKILRGGLFVFDFSEYAQGQLAATEDIKDIPGFDDSVEALRNRTAVINAYLSCLYTAVAESQQARLQNMVFSLRDLGAMSHIDDDWATSLPTNTSFISYWALYTAMLSEVKSNNSADRFMHDVMRSTRETIESDSLDKSFNLLLSILDHPNADVLVVAELLAHAYKYFEDHSYDLSLITSWTIAEKLLNVLWNRYIADQENRDTDGRDGKFINGDRRGSLTGPEFTASIIAEILSLAGRLPFDLYKDISKVRRARNGWMHELKKVTPAESSLAVKVAERMLANVENIKLDAPLAREFHSAG